MKNPSLPPLLLSSLFFSSLRRGRQGPGTERVGLHEPAITSYPWGSVTSLNAPALVLALPTTLVPVRHARSTILLGSIAAIRQAGHFDRYAEALAPEHRDELLHAVAGTWIDVAVARSHYRACEALGLSPDEEVELGRAVFERTGDTMFGTVIRLAKGAGATPWTLLPHLQRFWERGYDGGGIAVWRLGPKEARIELNQCSLSEARYFRNAVRGLFGTVVQLFCTRAYMQEIPGARSPGCIALRAQWA